MTHGPASGVPEVAPGVAADSPLGHSFTSIMQGWLALHTDVPDRLFHYTGTSGLEGILRSNCFWASHAEYLNDASELRYAGALVERVIAEVSGTLEQIWLRDAMTSRPDLTNPLVLGERPFVVCFCEEGDLLSQWRGYGSRGPAYALGVDLHRQAAMWMLPKGCVLRRVIYDRDEQEQLVRTAVRSWVAAVEAELQGRTDYEGMYPYPALPVLQRMLIEMHLCFKNPGFQEEREWRLIKIVDATEEVRSASDRLRAEQFRSRMAAVREQMRQAGVDRDFPDWPERNPTSWSHRAEGLEIKFRQSSIGFVPYIEMALIESAGVFIGRLPIPEVVLGPTNHPELSFQSLLLFLDAQGYGSHTEVRASAIPLRADL